MKQRSRLLSLLTRFILAAVIFTSGIVIGADEVQTGNVTNDSFNKSKKLLERVIYKEPEHRIDIYCGCQYDEKEDVDSNSCGYQPQKDNKRAHRIEWEHAVPAEAFGQSFREWREGPRIASTIEASHSRAVSALRGSILNSVRCKPIQWMNGNVNVPVGSSRFRVTSTWS